MTLCSKNSDPKSLRTLGVFDSNGRYNLQKRLADLPLGRLRYFESIGSTNDVALAWATEDAPDLSLVIADEQTQGRGRLDRKWFTPRGTALAFSLILHPPSAALRAHLSRTVGLAALAIADSYLKHGLYAQIKWPNDILLNSQKTAGILIETVWSGDTVDSVVIGIGVNVMKAAVPPAHDLQFPATSIEDVLGYSPDRADLLHDILKAIIEWCPRIDTEEFLSAWEEKLAFRGKQVEVHTGNGEVIAGTLIGLESDGGLRLHDEYGNLVTVRFGDVSLRPAA